jgi:hypothetical protein
LELGAGLERERAWSLERLEPDPRRTQVSIFFWCLFCLFVCGAALHKIRSVAVQLHKQHLLLLLCIARKEEEEGDGITFFFFFFVQRKKFQRIRARSSELLLFVSLFFLLFLLAPLCFF